MAGTKTDSIARQLYRLGWAGFCIQLILLLAALVMLAWVSLGGVGARPVMSRTDYVALVGLAILIFTTFWSYRYTRLARRIAEPGDRPPHRAVVNTLWVGLWASALGVALSTLLLVIEVVRLLIVVMKAPQAGVPVIQTQAENRAAWVSGIDVVSLLADVTTLAAELTVLGFTLWLLFRITRAAEDYESAPPIGSS
jgi:hypothetical protein